MEHLRNQDLSQEEQKSCRQRSRAIKDQLLKDKAVSKNWKRRKTDLNMAWINFRMVYDDRDLR